MAYTLGNKCAKNLCKWVVLLQLIIENVVTCFFGTQCSLASQVFIIVCQAHPVESPWPILTVLHQNVRKSLPYILDHIWHR